MKALILAGGKGTRLRPLTHSKNKHMIPLGGQPMLFHVIDNVIRAGSTEVIINLNKGDTEIPTAIASQGWAGVDFKYIEQDKPNGIMYPLVLAQEMIAGDEFIFHAGDNVLLDELKDHVDVFRKNKSDAHLLVTKVDNPERFGVAVVDKNGKLEKTVEKPTEFVSNLAVTAIYLYRGDAVFEAMKHIKPQKIGWQGTPEYYPPPVHQWLVDNKYLVTTEEITGHWKDTGKPHDLLEASRLLLEHKKDFPRKSDLINTQFHGRIQVGKDCLIRNCTIQGDVIIGDHCTIENCIIGPNVCIGDSSVIESATIKNAILQPHVRIFSPGMPINNALIGERGVIRGVNTGEVGTLMIADDGVVLM